MVQSDNRKAAAIHGDAIGDGEMRRDRRSVNGQAAAPLMQLQGIHSAKTFDNARKH